MTEELVEPGQYNISTFDVENDSRFVIDFEMYYNAEVTIIKGETYDKCLRDKKSPKFKPDTLIKSFNVLQNSNLVMHLEAGEYFILFKNVSDRDIIYSYKTYEVVNCLELF